MAFGRLERTPSPRPFSDINMTPLIDVMLVLLVIFMIAAPLMTHGLPLDLPSADQAPPTASTAFVAISLDANGQLALGDEPLTRDQLAARLKLEATAQPALDVHLRIDRKVPYGEVTGLIELVQAAGLTKIGFVTEAAGLAGR